MYKQIVEFLRQSGVDFDEARADLKRWKSWGGKPIAVQAGLRKRERKAREAEQEPQPELADPDRQDR
ncbi:hypothetical protein MalM25_33620 [Planctomycetes bacterium MalM25]|nr:hypothetical protein MalM25_33620 [Planctomycetes bacterium MalM25]